MTMRVVLYRRVSHIRQERGASLETQQEMARAYCDERGWQIVNDIVETHSAEDIWEREGLSGARDLIRSGKADILLCHAVDRLTRNQNHLGIILDELERHGGRLDLVTEDVEATPIGKAVISFRAMAAEFEREKLIERTTRGMKQRIASG